MMKWPASVTLVRHDTSIFNVLKKEKAKSPLYQEFLSARQKDNGSAETRILALRVKEKFSLTMGDADTPLSDKEGDHAYKTGLALSSGQLPDIVFVSPYERTLRTLDHIARGWLALAKVETYEEERIREQEHGLALLYNDWKVFEAIHPEQRALRTIEGEYWYRYPQGENVPDVRSRNRAWLITLTRDFAGKHILAITHHLNILATRANLERWGADKFISLDKHEKPINCGVTIYRGFHDKGKEGKLILESYNVKYY